MVGRRANKVKAHERRAGRGSQWRAYALAVGAAGAALAVLIALVEAGGDHGGGVGTPLPLADATADTPLRSHILGDAAAPVTLLEYSDYR